MEIIVLLVPILVSIYLFKHKNKEVTWWEYVVLIGGSFLLYFLLKLTAVSIITSDTEYWGGYITKTTYYEPWNELVEVTKTRTDSEGKEETYTTTETEYHHEKYTYQTNLSGEEITCSRKEFEEIKHLFGVYPKFRELNRHYYTKDGDAYDYYWGGSDLTMWTITEEHRYKNPMKGSRSLFQLSGEKNNLYDYPKLVRKDQRVILGMKKTLSDQRLRVLNSKLGKEYQVRVFLLLFPDSCGIRTAIDQRNYWEGGNKNELVICVGIKNDSVTWCYPFSWCDSPEVETRIKNWYIENPRFSISGLCDFLEPTIRKYWVRKKFSDFDYINTDILGWEYMIIFLIVLAYIILISHWICENDQKN